MYSNLQVNFLENPPDPSREIRNRTNFPERSLTEHYLTLQLGPA